MPSAKNSKGSQVHYPPSNRAFALRMMNSSQNNEGRVSPFDRALKPLRDSFKKSKSKKKSKEIVANSSNMDQHSDLDSKDDDSLDSSYEVSSPTYDIQHKESHSMPWTTQSRKVTHDGGRSSNRGDESQMAPRPSNSHIVDHQTHHSQQWYPGYRGMADIAEEEEFYHEHNKFDNENLAYYNHGTERQIHVEKRHGKLPHQRSRNKAERHDDEANANSNHTAHFDNELQADHGDYFMTSNGDIVKLRRKKTADNQESRGQSNNIDALRAERFGKRLSMLCHMLADKYPEDFHILELLVELQVSNEKREDEMSRSVEVLKKKVDTMEERLAALEKQSLPGFQQLLMPLATAADAFSNGLKQSLSNFQTFSSVESEKSCEFIDKEIKTFKSTRADENGHQTLNGEGLSNEIVEKMQEKCNEQIKEGSIMKSSPAELKNNDIVNGEDGKDMEKTETESRAESNVLKLEEIDSFRSNMMDGACLENGEKYGENRPTDQIIYENQEGFTETIGILSTKDQADDMEEATKPQLDKDDVIEEDCIEEKEFESKKLEKLKSISLEEGLSLSGKQSSTKRPLSCSETTV